MKRFTFLAIAATILIAGACKKDNSATTGIMGKWLLVKQYSSTGGPGVWTDERASGKYVQFNSNGLIHSNMFTDNAKYAIKDSVTLTIMNADATSYDYRYNLGKDTLIISPFCYEGCSMKFVRN